jgi:hypothetical protein
VKQGLSIFEEHFDYFLEVLMEFIEAFRLRMGSWKTRHITNVESSVRASFYHGRKTSHLFPRRPSLAVFFEGKRADLKPSTSVSIT